jgi:molecular chaperone GrpE
MKKHRSHVDEEAPPEPADRADEEPGDELPEEDLATRFQDPQGGEDDSLRREFDALNDRHLRLAAEFDNFRKRSQAEIGSSGTRAQAALVERLLEILDDLHRVTSMDTDGATVESVMEGVDLVERKMHRLLTDAGLETLDPQDDPFDPNIMEAMIRVPTESPEEDDTVAQVLQPGFRFRGHLIRPARVSVRKLD